MSIPIRQYWDLLVNYLRPQWPRALLLAGLLFGSIGLQLVNPQVLRYFIDTATVGGASQALAQAALLFIAVALANQALSVTATYVSENVAWSATNALREDLAMHCLRLDMPFHKAHTPGEMIERIDGDVTALANFFSQFVIYVFGNAVLLVGVLVVLWGIDWRAGLVMSAFAVVGMGGMLRARNVAVPFWEQSRQAAADLSGYLVERLAGTEDIRSSGAVAYVLRGFFGHLRRLYDTTRKATLVGTVMSVIILSVMAVGTVAAFVIAALLFRGGLITIGTAYIIFHYSQMMFRPLNLISRQMEELQKASAGIERIRRLYSESCTVEDGPGAALPTGPLAVEFAGVSFGYDGDETVLDGISFRLAPGQVLGLLGRTGSGKTTLARLLCRLYDADSGAILLGGTDIRRPRLAELRRRVGVVTQDVQLFQATVRDNLTFFDPTASDKTIVAVLEELGLGDWYRALPNGLDSEMAADATGLSAGEAQLLAFARVFLQDPGLVILDEASSRLDSATEQRIEHAVDRLLCNRTGLIVAHRLGTVGRADEIMILDRGHVCEYGARERLAGDPNSRFAGLLRTGLEEALA
ncbi:MAG TPA: ABC transporter ATP-binding protein [Anaerolineae bacterium]|nr:ABC transporter ATP-binding protein [Anaerolineae bacterium]HOQ98985.1 ABC transporter ATP-binding protein [Anaerolineae bacterium]HPL28902.1 ABC transporter ATP-binding protein [Anaerolineae bacterium]